MRLALVILSAAVLTTWTGNAQDIRKPAGKPAEPKPSVRKMTIASSSNFRGYEIGKWSYTQVVLELEVSKAGGKGLLILDPNTHHLDGYGNVTGGTKIGYPIFEFKITPAEKSDSTGPPIYRIEGDKLPEKMLLVVPEESGRVCRLIITDDKYVPVRVILLEPRPEK